MSRHFILSLLMALATSLAGTIAFAASPAGASSDARTHARVQATHGELVAVLGSRVDAIDYGRMQWITASAEQLERLRASGIAVTEAAEPFTLDLGGRRFDPLTAIPAALANWGRLAETDGSDWRLVQFVGPVRQAWLDELRAAGLEPAQYIHPFTYVVWGTRAALTEAAKRPAVRWSGDFLPAYRVLPRWRSLGADPIAVHVTVHHGIDLGAGLRAAGATFVARAEVDRHFSSVELRVGGDRFAALAALPGVYSIQPVPTDGGLRGEMSDQINAGNYGDDNFAFPGYLDYLVDIGVDGTGVIVADVDGGVWDTHPDLVNRMLPCSGDTCGGSATDAHGTHTSGIIAGDGSSGTTTANGFLRGLGMAPGANLVEQVYSPFFTQPGGMLKLMTDSVRNQAVTSGNSWGPAGSPRGYDDDTRQVDVGVRDADPDAPGDQPLSYVLSFMNGYGGFQSQGSPDEGKNLFTIGSTKMQSSSTVQIAQIDDLSSNSAHGPALDGRTIPAMVAPGCQVDSTISATGYGLMCGTSMASPHVTGAGALFTEYYRNLTGNDPSPALVKAAFTAVAKDLTGHDDADGNPIDHLFDSKQGWGRMQIDPVLAPDHAVAYVDQSIVFDATGDAWTHTYSAADPAEPMRLMLVWTDAPGHGLGGSTPAWNNNLDLRVTGAGGTFLGNVLDGGWSTTGGSADPMNNTEAVFLQPAQHGGSISVEVLATDINSDALPNAGDDTDQDFALVCYNCTDVVDDGADIAFAPLLTEGFLVPGGTFTLGISVVNNGPEDASGIHLEVSTDLANATVSDEGFWPEWTCDLSAVVPSCDYDGAIEAGATSTLIGLTLHAPADAPFGPFSTKLTISGAGADPDPSNNSMVFDLDVIDRIFRNDFEALAVP
jgi:hypothetical protein